MNQNRTLQEQSFHIQSAIETELLSFGGILGELIDDTFHAPHGTSLDYEFISVKSENSLRLLLPALLELSLSIQGAPLAPSFMKPENQDILFCAFDPTRSGALKGAIVLRPKVYQGEPKELNDHPWHNEKPGNSWVVDFEIVSTLLPESHKNILSDDGDWWQTGVRGAIASSLAVIASFAGMKINDNIAALGKDRVWIDVTANVHHEIPEQEDDDYLIGLLMKAMESTIDYMLDGRPMLGLDNFQYQQG